MTAILDDQGKLQRVQRVPIGPLQIDRFALQDIPEVLVRFLEDGSPHQIATVNLQFLGIASRNPSFAEVVNQADLVVADGMPLLGLSKLRGLPIPHRITGHDLLHIAASLASRQGYSMAFLGAEPGVAEEASRRLRQMYPGLGPIKTYQGSFSQDGYGLSPEDEDGLMESLRLSRPHILLVALGCPKQDFWIARHLPDVGIPICIGVGGVLDVLAGNLKRAPLWMQRAGLEWSYRLCQEPHRLWKRYLLDGIPTLSKLGAAALAARGQTWPADSNKAGYSKDEAAR